MEITKHRYALTVSGVETVLELLGPDGLLSPHVVEHLPLVVVVIVGGVVVLVPEDHSC